MRIIILTAFVAVVAAAPERIELDWLKIKPITEYPEFWEAQGVNPPSSGFEKIDRFVSNGNVAGRNDFPFKAALISAMPFGDSLCGASLISRMSVLTAAHCIHGAANSVIILGASDLSNPNEPNQVRFRVQSTNYRIHHHYRAGVTNSDIGIVRFNFAIHMYTEFVNAIQMPSEALLNDALANENSVVMGFGRYSDASDNFAYNLQFIDVATMTNTACSLRFPQRIDNSHICTSGLGGRGVCDGDIGSPLAIEQNGVYTQIGIASFFPDAGCTTGTPSVHTRITSFWAWIQENM